MGPQHGKKYTQLVYHYTDPRVNAQSPFAAESFLLETDKHSVTFGKVGESPDLIEMGNVRVTVPPGWLFRSQMSGVYDQFKKRFVPPDEFGRPDILMPSTTIIQPDAS